MSNQMDQAIQSVIDLHVLIENVLQDKMQNKVSHHF